MGIFSCLSVTVNSDVPLTMGCGDPAIGKALNLKSIDCCLKLADLYEKVELPT